MYGKSLEKSRRWVGGNRQTISLKNNLYNCWNETCKWPIDPLDRTVCLFRQKEIRERDRKQGQRISLFDKTFYNENKEKHFYQTIPKQLLSNFKL